MQGIFHTLNMLSVDVTSKALIAECWIPDADEPRVRLALKQASVSDTNYITSGFWGLATVTLANLSSLMLLKCGKLMYPLPPKVLD